MNTMLSIPSTISSNVSVASAIHASGLVSSSSILDRSLSVTRRFAANSLATRDGRGTPHSWDIESLQLLHTRGA